MTFKRYCNTAIILICSVFIAMAWAQEPPVKPAPTRLEMQENIESLFSSVLPAQTKASEASLEMFTKYAERLEVADRIAKYKRNLFDALKKQGSSDRT
jgi:hypothetical protein